MRYTRTNDAALIVAAPKRRPSDPASDGSEALARVREFPGVVSARRAVDIIMGVRVDFGALG